MVHSVRKAKAITPPSYLQLMSLIDMVAYHKDGRKVHHIKEIRPAHIYQSIPFDMRKSAVMTFIAEITSKCLQTAYPQHELFEFLYSSLTRFDDPSHYDPDFLIRLLVSLSHYLGFGMEVPHEDEAAGRYFDLMEGHLVRQRPVHNYVVDAADILQIGKIMQGNVTHSSGSTGVGRMRILELLVVYYQLHVEALRDVRSLKMLRELS